MASRPAPNTQASLPFAAASEAVESATGAASGATVGGAETLTELAEQARGCRLCPWAQDSTQTVFGHGPEHAQVMLVGEQPGDQEDLAGLPFVGPAGRLLRGILAEVPLDPDACYLTNAVKHFKWTPRGKRRIHQKPAATDIGRCRPILAAERAFLRPRLIVALGLVGAHGLLGKAVRLGDVRGRRLGIDGCDNLWITSHPSAILRMPEPGLQEQAQALMVGELRRAVATLAA